MFKNIRFDRSLLLKLARVNLWSFLMILSVSFAYAKDETAALNLNKVSLSLMKATHFLINKTNPKPDRDALIVINYLQMRYGINIPYPTFEVQENKNSLNSSNVIIYSKWYDKSYVLQKKIYKSKLHSLDSLLIVSLYCNKYGLPDNFYDLIDSMSLSGGYYLTHACLYFQLSKNNGCLPVNRTVDNLQKKISARLDSFVDINKGHLYDNEIEAIAMQSFMNKPVKDSSIYNIMLSQSKDGGWCAFKNDTDSYHHTTALAIWALSAYTDGVKVPDNINTLFYGLTPAQQFCSWFLLSSADTNIVLADLNQIYGIRKLENGAIKYGGYFIGFDSIFSKFEKYSTDNEGLPSIESVMNNDDSLAYFIFYIDKLNTDIKSPYIETVLSDLEEYRQEEGFKSNILRFLLLEKLLKKYNSEDFDKSTGRGVVNIHNQAFDRIIKLYLGL